ncbi:hypothetical protein GZA09_25680, partial [Escherichia coli]|nr:hypothetical protein [Escherichia coli]
GAKDIFAYSSNKRKHIATQTQPIKKKETYKIIAKKTTNYRAKPTNTSKNNNTKRKEK